MIETLDDAMKVIDGHNKKLDKLVLVLKVMGFKKTKKDRKLKFILRCIGSLDKRLQEIAGIIDYVDNRCMAVDGPVTPTLQEMSQSEISKIYSLAVGKRQVKCFHLQSTKSFELAPQREDYECGRDYDMDCEKYAEEWLQQYECQGCTFVMCPQCGKDQ